MLSTLRSVYVKSRVVMTTLVTVAVVTVMITGFLAWKRFQHEALDWVTVETRTLTVLKSEPLVFLTTDRLVAQIVVESREYNMLLGQREGYLVSTVRLYYGVNLAKLTPANLHRSATLVIVTVPEPEVLDFAVDLESLRFMSKRNVTVAISDWLQGRNLESDLRARLKADALAFMAVHQLIPARATIVVRLNNWAPVLSGALGVEVRFE